MLSAMRKFAKSWVAALFIGLLVISFAVFGIGDVFQANGGDWVVRAGSRTVSSAEFRRIFDNVKAQAQEQAGQAVTNEEAVARGLHARVLEDLAGAEAFAEVLRRMGLAPSDKLVVAEIRKAPVFFDAVSGRFDQAAYERQLSENGLTPDRFESFLRDELAQGHFVAGLVAGLKAPRVYAAAAQAFEGERRDLSLALVHPGLIQQPPAPTDAQLTTFMNENAERLRRPEMRALTVVRFSAQNVPAPGAADAAEVQRRYNFRRDSLSTPERRTLVQVPARTAAAAAQAAQRLRAGEDPAAVARALGVDPVRFDNVARSAIPDRRVADAAFTLPAGQVSAPIQGELGFSVVRVLAVAPGKVVTLEEVRPQIEAEIRAEAAAEAVYELVQKYEQARESGATLAEAARAAGVPSLSLAPVTQDGRDRRGQPVALEPQLLKAAFAEPQGAETQVEEIAPGQYAAVRVERVLPPSMPALAEVRDQLAAVWRGREISRRVRARADAIAASARAGQPLQTLAGQANAPFTRIAGAQRTGGAAQVPPEILGDAFAARPGGVFVAVAQQGAVVVGRVDAVRAAPLPELAAGVEQRRSAMTLDVIQEIGALARNSARRDLKVRTNPDRARAALGVEPAAEGEGAAPSQPAR